MQGLSDALAFKNGQLGCFLVSSALMFPSSSCPSRLPAPHRLRPPPLARHAFVNQRLVFHQILSGQLPETLLFSHDLIEGAHIRVGLASDIQRYDN